MNKCLRCGNSWVPRKQEKSSRCPKCGSSVWDKSEKAIEKKLRKCGFCGQTFGPMTDALWKINEYQHYTMSEKHKNHLRMQFNPYVSDFDGKMISFQMLRESKEENYFIVCFDRLTENDKLKLEDRFLAKSGKPRTCEKHNIIMINRIPVVGNRIKFRY